VEFKNPLKLFPVFSFQSYYYLPYDCFSSDIDFPPFLKNRVRVFEKYKLNVAKKKKNNKIDKKKSEKWLEGKRLNGNIKGVHPHHLICRE